MTNVLSTFAAMLCLSLCLVAHAAALATPEPPIFEDVVAPDSPNAAARLIWLCGQLPREVSNQAGWIDTEQLEVWRLPSDLEGADYEGMPTAEGWAKQLAELRPWTDAWVKATQLATFEPFLRRDPVRGRPPYPKDDPRFGMLSDIRRCSRVLTDDARRLWIAGDHDAAIERVEALLQTAVWLGAQEAGIFHAIVAGSLIESALDTHDAFLDASPGGPSRKRLLDLASIFQDRDPAGIQREWSRSYTQNRAWIKDQLSTEGGGIEAWIAIGQAAGFQAALDQFFEPALAELSGEHREDADRPTIDGEALSTADRRRIVELVSEQLGGLTVDDLRAAYAEWIALGDEVQQEWSSPRVHQHMKAAETLRKRDSTMIGSLLGVSHVSRLHATWSSLRDRVDQAPSRVSEAQMSPP